MYRFTRAILPTPLAAVAALALLGAGAGRAAAAAKTAPATPLDSRTLSRRIDQAIEQRLRAEKIQASPRADDAEFLRRLYLDLTGRIPPANRAAAFLDSGDPDKRAKLIDELLASPAYGKHQADVWQALLLPRNSDNRRLQAMFASMTRWLEKGFNDNKPWDRMVRELLTAEGQPDKNGAVVYYLANPTPDKLTDNVTRMFLGVQLQCAQCHNHPFTSWKQTEYWGMAAFFTKVRRQGNPRQVARRGGTVSIGESGRGRPARLPVSAKVVPPKFLQGEEPELRKDAPYRPALAEWMTAPANPFFSRAMVNRTWAQLFGRGFTSPVDDMHEGNPPSHPELLAELADQFAAHDFDLKFLIRTICNSEAYQRTSKPRGNNAGAGPELFSRMSIKVMTPEQLYDSLTLVLGTPNQPAVRNGRGGKAVKNGKPIPPAKPAAAARRPGNNQRAAFVSFFEVPDGSDPTEYQAGIPQALRLMNSRPLNNAAMLNPLLRSGTAPAQVIRRLYVTTLSRRPRPEEMSRCLKYVREHGGEQRQAYADVLWALINCSEFTLNH